MHLPRAYVRTCTYNYNNDPSVSFISSVSDLLDWKVSWLNDIMTWDMTDMRHDWHDDRQTLLSNIRVLCETAQASHHARSKNNLYKTKVMSYRYLQPPVGERQPHSVRRACHAGSPTVSCGSGWTGRRAKPLAIAPGVLPTPVIYLMSLVNSQWSMVTNAVLELRLSHSVLWLITIIFKIAHYKIC